MEKVSRARRLLEQVLRTKRGSKVARYKGGVGKFIGGMVYLHRNYAQEVIPSDVWETALKVLDSEYPGFAYNAVVYDLKKRMVRFVQAPDFDQAREPHVGQYVSVFSDGSTRQGHSNSIWHHKWLWVRPDYKGFDVKKSMEWSEFWLSRLEGTAKGTDRTWTKQLTDQGIGRAWEDSR